MESETAVRAKRHPTRPVKVGPVVIGGKAPVSIQSMTNARTTDTDAVLRQIDALAAEGCEIVRVAVPDRASAKALSEIAKRSALPVVADIHFDQRLAIAAIEAGVRKVRINPGNIGGPEVMGRIAAAAKAARVPMRIGANSGSILRKVDRRRLEEGTGPRATPELMVERVMEFVALCEEEGYRDLVLSLKCSGALETIQAYRLASARCEYPLHLGVTAAGSLLAGAIRSAVGIGALLLEGIGDTVRVSLTGDPVEEVRAAKHLLEAVRLRQFGPVVIACPTCARCDVDLVGVVAEVEQRLKGVKTPITVAVMGCEVNGPGEAADADIGIAAGKGWGTLFRKGNPIRKVRESQFVEELLNEIETFR